MEGLAGANPVIGTNKREERARNRVLDDELHAKDDELATIWSALGDDQHSDIVRLLLLTGQRKNEIAALRWSEIDLDRSVIFLPGDRVKNGRPHRIPMSAPVRQILERQKRIEGRDLVFGHGEGPFAGWRKCKERLDEHTLEIRKSAATKAGRDPKTVKPLDHWVLHDLRRTTVTGMADIGIEPHIVEAVVNHASGHKGGIAGTYNYATCEPQKADALVRWADHVLAIVEGRERKILSFNGGKQNAKSAD
jgi:integrase